MEKPIPSQCVRLLGKVTRVTPVYHLHLELETPESSDTYQLVLDTKKTKPVFSYPKPKKGQTRGIVAALLAATVLSSQPVNAQSPNPWITPQQQQQAYENFWRGQLMWERMLNQQYREQHRPLRPVPLLPKIPTLDNPFLEDHDIDEPGFDDDDE
jgi:hypothetical protein